MRCTVIGAGVCGLSCAIRLLEAGWVVEVIAEKVSPETVSDRAAAVWYPFLVAPVDRAEVWGMASYSVFRSFQPVSRKRASSCALAGSTYANR